ncbi:unnamed protein product [Coregonus sp. 'balchen']|nr:unnamed protein product [Coregonus sp. 'balchen']
MPHPVLLSCSHSFCRPCLGETWREQRGIKDCPICRRRSSRDHPRTNLALRSIYETLLKEWNSSSQKAVSSPELIQQALQHPDMSQSAVQHVEASANVNQWWKHTFKVTEEVEAPVSPVWYEHWYEGIIVIHD